MWRNCYVHNIVFPFCWLFFFFLNHSSIYLKVSLTLQFGLLAVHLSLTIQTLNFVHRLKVLYRVFTMVLVNSVALSLVACLYRNLAPLWSSAFMEVVKKYLLYYCLFLRKKKNYCLQFSLVYIFRCLLRVPHFVHSSKFFQSQWRWIFCRWRQYWS